MRGFEFDLDYLINPAAVFDHPRDVLNDPDLTRQEKRAILSAWPRTCARSGPYRAWTTRPKPNDQLRSTTSWMRFALWMTTPADPDPEAWQCA